MQSGPEYPRTTVLFKHPSLDLAVPKVDRPGCSVPLYPSDQRIVGHHGLRYWGYAPSLSNRTTHRYAVAVVDVDTYESEEPRERDDGIEWRVRFRSGTYEEAIPAGLF